LIYLAQLRLFAADVGLRDGDFYITIDGSPMVKFGDKAYESSRPLHMLSEAAMWARPINRSKRDSLKPHPFFRGSTGGFEFLHCTLHTIDGKISMTVYVDMSPKFNLTESTRKCMDALALFGLKPAWIVVDKEFTGNGAVWEAIRDYADGRDFNNDHRKVLVLGPHVRRARIVEDLQRHWDDELFQSAKYAGHRIWWTFIRTSWSRDSKGYRPYGIVVVYEEVPHDFMPDDPHGVIVNQGEPGVKPRVCAFPIQVNKLIRTEAEFIAVFEAVPRRWACEALFQRHEMRFARSKSSDLLPRQVYYNFSLALLNCYGHWREKKRQLLGRPHRVALGMSWWMGDLLACMDVPEIIGTLPLLHPKRRSTRWSNLPAA
jgi:hypothetical protein